MRKEYRDEWNDKGVKKISDPKILKFKDIVHGSNLNIALFLLASETKYANENCM